VALGKECRGKAVAHHEKRLNSTGKEEGGPKWKSREGTIDQFATSCVRAAAKKGNSYGANSTDEGGAATRKGTEQRKGEKHRAKKKIVKARF